MLQLFDHVLSIIHLPEKTITALFIQRICRSVRIRNKQHALLTASSFGHLLHGVQRGCGVSFAAVLGVNHKIAQKALAFAVCFLMDGPEESDRTLD